MLVRPIAPGSAARQLPAAGGAVEAVNTYSVLYTVPIVNDGVGVPPKYLNAGAVFEAHLQ